jgi:hypothetical protein
MFQNVPKLWVWNIHYIHYVTIIILCHYKIMILLGIFLLDLGVGWIRQVLAHQKQGPRATIGAARRALCYDGSEEPSPGPATYASETKYKAPVLQVCWGFEGRKNGDVLDDFWDVFNGFMIGKHVVL